MMALSPLCTEIAQQSCWLHADDALNYLLKMSLVNGVCTVSFWCGHHYQPRIGNISVVIRNGMVLCPVLVLRRENDDFTDRSPIVENMLLTEISDQLECYYIYALFFRSFYCVVRENLTFPLFISAPPMHVLVNGLSPHTALAARMHPSHRPFVISIVCPGVAASNDRNAPPDEPVVFVGFPWHCSIVPAMPPQIERRATLISWLLIVL